RHWSGRLWRIAASLFPASAQSRRKRQPMLPQAQARLSPRPARRQRPAASRAPRRRARIGSARPPDHLPGLPIFRMSALAARTRSRPAESERCCLAASSQYSPPPVCPVLLLFHQRNIRRMVGRMAPAVLVVVGHALLGERLHLAQRAGALRLLQRE